jgi:hypothetical protein
VQQQRYNEDSAADTPVRCPGLLPPFKAQPPTCLAVSAGSLLVFDPELGAAHWLCVQAAAPDFAPSPHALQPSTINLRPAARRLIFESAQLPAATKALPATDPCLNSSIRNDQRDGQRSSGVAAGLAAPAAESLSPASLKATLPTQPGDEKPRSARRSAARWLPGPHSRC